MGMKSQRGRERRGGLKETLKAQRGHSCKGSVLLLQSENGKRSAERYPNETDAEWRMSGSSRRRSAHRTVVLCLTVVGRCVTGRRIYVRFSFALPSGRNEPVVGQCARFGLLVHCGWRWILGPLYAGHIQP